MQKSTDKNNKTIPSEIIEIIQCMGGLSSKIHGILDKDEIFRIIGNKFVKSKYCDGISILLLSEDGASLRVARSSVNSSNLKKGEKICGVKVKHYRIKLAKSSIYNSVVKEGKSRKVMVVDILNELFSKPISRSIVKLFKYENKECILTPLKRHGKIIGVLVMSSFGFADNLFISVKNFAHHISSALEFAYECDRRKKIEEEIVYRSQHDQLTGLYNRFFIEESIKRLDTAKQMPLSIIIGDVNGLKLVNDKFGHTSGDNLLREAAEVIKGVCRKSDIIGRWGGDEFLMLLPKTNEKSVIDICERIRQVCVHSVKTKITLSIALGEATKKKISEDLQKIMIEAERRMYANKMLNRKSEHSYLIFSLQTAMNEKNSEVRKHTQRLRGLAITLGSHMGLSVSEMDSLELLAMLHDIGKMAIARQIITKPSKLSAKEYKEIKRHPEIGYRIIRLLPGLGSVAEAIKAHHEWWNGKGYPHGLKGEEIPLISRIVAVVDAYDVMVYGKRAYKEKITKKQALDELQNCAGSQFDPQIIKIFKKIIVSGKVNFVNC